MNEPQPEHLEPQLHKDQHRRLELLLVGAILMLCAFVAGAIWF